MTTAFLHPPSARYWETDAPPAQHYRNAYPEGTIEVPVRPGPDHVWDGTGWLHQPQPQPEPEPVPVPAATPLQLFDELDQVHGIDLEAEIGAVSQKALRRFRLANEIDPAEQFALALQNRLGWTDAAREALFRAAAARA